MCIVTLKDGTTYHIDTNNEREARCVVVYKLRDHLDYREIESSILIEGAIMDKNNKYYNSNNCYDGLELKAIKGWSYKWSNAKCAEFR